MPNGSRLARYAFVSLLIAGCSGADDELGTSSEDALRGGRQLSEAEVATLVRNAGFAPEHVGRMVCIANYESNRFDGSTNRNSNGTVDRGLFQINEVHLRGTPGCPRDANALFDAETNARCALGVSRTRSGFNAWTVYRTHPECASYRLQDDPSGRQDVPPGRSGGSYGPPAGQDAGAGNDPYGKYGDDAGSDPYGNDPYGNDPYGSGSGGGDPYGGKGGNDPYGYDPYGNDPYGSGGYGCDPYADPDCGGGGGYW